MIRNVLNHVGQKIGEMYFPEDASDDEIQRKLAVYAEPPVVLSQREKDLNRYLKRAKARPMLMALMAEANMNRLRTGVWTSADIVSLTTDAQLQEISNDMNTLSFEIVLQKIPTITNPLITSEIKANWSDMLKANLFMEG